MHLLTLICGIVFLPKAHTLKCYECTDDTGGACTEREKTCLAEDYQCAVLRVTSYAADLKVLDVSFKDCILPDGCLEGSVNFGITRSVLATKCCTSDLCNSQRPSELSRSNPNGKQCYSCQGKGCKAVLDCEGIEDHCISTEVKEAGRYVKLKGCASKHMCTFLPMSGTFFDLSCCEGDLCNAAVSRSAGLLLLVMPLLSWLMLS